MHRALARLLSDVGIAAPSPSFLRCGGTLAPCAYREP